MTRSVQVYLASRFFAASAMTAGRATILWHVYDRTGSKAMLGLVGLFQFIPAVVASLSGGVVADRADRTIVIRAAQLVGGAVSPVLLLATLSDAVSARGLLLAAAVLAGAAAFEQPSRASLLVALVPREVFPVTVTRAATLQALAFATGPALAGLLIAQWGPAAAYAAHAGLMVASIVLVTFLPRSRGTGSPLAPLRAIAEGLAFVRSNRIVLACMSLDMFAVILGGASALLPVFAEDVLDVGARGYGALAMALEVGALGTSLALAARRPIHRAGPVLLLSVALYGVATVAFGLSRFMPFSLIVYALVGAADQVSVVLRATVVQMSTPDAVRGRVSSINMLFIQASNQLGALESGLLASAIGAPAAVVVGGVGAVLVAVVYAVRFPELRAYRTELAGP